MLGRTPAAGRGFPRSGKSKRIRFWARLGRGLGDHWIFNWFTSAADSRPTASNSEHASDLNFCFLRVDSE